MFESESVPFNRMDLHLKKKSTQIKWMYIVFLEYFMVLCQSQH